MKVPGTSVREGARATLPCGCVGTRWCPPDIARRSLDGSYWQVILGCVMDYRGVPTTFTSSHRSGGYLYLYKHEQVEHDPLAYELEEAFG